MSPTQHIADLLYKDLEGKLSAAEAIELQEWKNQQSDHQQFYEKLQSEEQFIEMVKQAHPENLKLISRNILQKIEDKIAFKVIPLYRRNFFRIAVAACIAAILLVGGYFLFFNIIKSSDTPPIAKTNDIQAPKENKAVIEVDGKTIAIDTLSSFTQGGVTVTKTADGRVVYTGFGEEVKFNTLTNPRGNKVIDIELADKSHVWLNAGSSITYPVAFTGDERKVTMTGEAAFKVTHNSAMPFTVTKGGTSVTVLGTEFNVNAYEDEPNMKVTLLEGSVRVNSDQKSLTIKPNQQAIVSSGSVDLNTNVNTEEVMAWRNGLFTWNSTNIKTIMREVSRYYNVEVLYEGNLPDGGFNADRISRNDPVSTLLKKLESTERIHFKIEGNKITVRP